MAQSKNFVERNAQHLDSVPYEIIALNTIRHKDGGTGDYLSHTLLGYIPEPEFKEMLATEGWNPEAMRISITVNNVRVIHATFEAMVNEFSNRLLETRMQRGGWDNFEKAVEKKAKHLLKGALGDFLDNAHKLNDNIGHLADASSELVQSAWNIPWRDLVTDEMKAAGEKAISAFGTFNDTETNRRVLSEKVYNAMASARPAPHDKSVKIKLPTAAKPGPGDLMGSYTIDKRELRGRMDMLNEVKAILSQYNINIED